MKPRSIRRATKKSLAAHGARFTIDGLRFHFQKLSQYTNPTGGGLDKIPLNTKDWLSLYYAQFEVFEPKSKPIWESSSPPTKPKPVYLRKKTQYQVADHLLGIGKKAYWTGSTRASMLLGLDIDDHDSTDEDEIRKNAEASLELFAEVTGLTPIPCGSPGGINGFLICHRSGISTEAINKVWHKLVRTVDEERCRRGYRAKLEPKGHARIFEAEMKYCGVLFKDPLWNCNPTDDELHSFWAAAEAEANSITGPQLIQCLSTVINSALPETVANETSSKTSVAACDDLLPVFAGQWVKMCRHWAIHGLPSDDSIYQVVHELTLWLFFVELFEVEESDRFEQVAHLLIHFVHNKHNGYVTRINDGQFEEVKNQIFRIVKSTVGNCPEKAKAVFADLRQKRSAGLYVDTWLLAPLLMKDCEASSSHTAALSPVRFTHCCTVSNWLPKPEYWRQKAEQWNPILDESPLPNQLEAGILRYYRRHGLRIKKPTIVKIRRFLNHISACSGEARLGIKSLKKLGFSGHHVRKHIKHLEDMGVIRTVAHSKSIGLSKGFVLLPPYTAMFDEAKKSTTDDCAS
jgi:hypothetical protein